MTSATLGTVLTAALIPLTTLMWFGLWLFGTVNKDFHTPEPWRWMASVLAPVAIAVYGLRRKSLNQSGALAGLVVGFCLTLSSLCFFAALLSFFLSASKATKFRGHLKRKLEEHFKEGGQRDWKQVVCNGGVAACLAVKYLIDTGGREEPVNFSRNYTSSWLATAVLGALACSCGDTFASEIGSVVQWGPTRLITNLEAVRRGTNGGVSLVGTLASGAGGMVVGVAYYLMLLVMAEDLPLLENPPQWPVVLVAALAGILGSMIDSLLGATFQYSGYDKKRGVIVESPSPNVQHISGVALFDNHTVNLLSSLITAIITPSLAATLWRSFS